MTIHTEGTRAGQVLVSEANGKLSREAITLTGGSYPAGQVLAKLANGKYTAYDAAGDAPEDTAVAVLFASVDASTADASGIAIVRLAEVDASLLVDADADALADLATKHIIAR